MSNVRKGDIPLTLAWERYHRARWKGNSPLDKPATRRKISKAEIRRNEKRRIEEESELERAVSCDELTVYIRIGSEIYRVEPAEWNEALSHGARPFGGDPFATARLRAAINHAARAPLLIVREQASTERCYHRSQLIIEGDRKRGSIMTRPTVQSMAALALVTALMAHLKKGGELLSADANSILERASSLLNVLSLSFNDVTKAGEVFATIRDALKT